MAWKVSISKLHMSWTTGARLATSIAGMCAPSFTTHIKLPLLAGNAITQLHVLCY